METLSQLLDGFRIMAGWFAAAPIPFAVGATLVISIIYFKWYLIGKATRSSLKDPYRGWTTPAEPIFEQSPGDADDQQISIVMRPRNRTGLSAFLVLFFGGGAVFVTFVAEPEAGEVSKHWFSVITMWVFSGGGLWLFWFSSTRLMFDGQAITKKAMLLGETTYPLNTLQTVRPWGKSFAGGADLEFSGQRKLRVRAQYSGYYELLRSLAQKDPRLSAHLRRMKHHIEKKL